MRAISGPEKCPKDEGHKFQGSVVRVGICTSSSNYFPARYVEDTLRESADVDNKDELVELVHSLLDEANSVPSSSEVEQKILDNFSKWVGSAKIAIGYLLYRYEFKMVSYQYKLG